MIQKLLRHTFCVQRKILAQEALLSIRNSQTYELRIPVLNNLDRITVNKNGTLKDLSRNLKEKYNMNEIAFRCNQSIDMPLETPITPMLNRYFYVYSKQYYPMQIQGQNFDYGKEGEIIQGIQSIELPALQRREVQGYFDRIDKWYRFKTGARLNNGAAKIKSQDASDIFVEALIDPKPQERAITGVELQWQRVYWKLEQLKQLKRQADEICLKQVKKIFSLGLLVLAGNVGFIWSGTYIFYSWDIVEPLAYFLSSFGGIFLASRYFKIGRPYSKHSYQEYLIKKVSPRVYQRMGLDIQGMEKLEMQLIQLQAILKDHYLKKL